MTEHAPEVRASESVRSRQYPPQTVLLYLELSLYWFALAFLWAGLITIVIQEMVRSFVGDTHKDLYLGWTLGVGAFISTVICLVVGAMSDRSRSRLGRRRPYIVVGTLLSVPSLMLVAYASSLAGLMVAFCLVQLWVNVATSPYQALVPDLVPKERQGTASAYLGLGSLFGTLGGLMACGLLYDEPRGRGLLLVMTVLAGLLLLAMLYTLARVHEESATDNATPNEGLIATAIDSFRVNPREHASFFWLIGSRFLINMGFYTVTEYLAYYVRDTLRVPPDQVKTKVMLIMMTATFSGVLGNFPAGILSDRVSKKRVVYASTSITGVAALCFLLSPNFAAALASAVVFGIGWGAFTAVDWALATNLLPDRDEAKFMGVWHVAFTVPQVIAPVVGGLIAFWANSTWGSGVGYRVIMFMVLIYLVAGTVMIRPVRERTFPAPTGEA